VDVQPIWDRSCVSCHSGEEPAAALDLSGEPTEYFSRSYEALYEGEWISYLQEFIGPHPDGQVTNVVPLPAKALGSHASPIVEVLQEGHQGVELTDEEWVKLLTWIDLNAPYYGTYRGRRNIKYQGEPDFRPLPE
jgi:hypothetical protein